MKKDSLREIREILEDAFLGKFDHGQGTWFCGTSRCIAGRKLSLDVAKTYGVSSEENLGVSGGSNGAAWRNYVINVMRKVISVYEDESVLELMSHAGGYARESWGLNRVEAKLMFAPDADYARQFHLLDLLEKGFRVSDTPDRENKIVGLHEFEYMLEIYERKVNREGEAQVYLKNRQSAEALLGQSTEALLGDKVYEIITLKRN